MVFVVIDLLLSILFSIFCGFLGGFFEVGPYGTTILNPKSPEIWFILIDAVLLIILGINKSKFTSKVSTIISILAAIWTLATIIIDISTILYI